MEGITSDVVFQALTEILEDLEEIDGDTYRAAVTTGRVGSGYTGSCP